MSMTEGWAGRVQAAACDSCGFGNASSSLSEAGSHEHTGLADIVKPEHRSTGEERQPLECQSLRAYHGRRPPAIRGSIQPTGARSPTTPYPLFGRVVARLALEFRALTLWRGRRSENMAATDSISIFAEGTFEEQVRNASLCKRGVTAETSASRSSSS